MKLNLLTNASLGVKLLVSFFVVGLVTVTVGGVGYLTLSSLTTEIDNIMHGDVQILRDAGKLQVLALTLRRYEKDFFLNIGNEKNNAPTWKNLQRPRRKPVNY